jgi:hypothetical protein
MSEGEGPRNSAVAELGPALVLTLRLLVGRLFLSTAADF